MCARTTDRLLLALVAIMLCSCAVPEVSSPPTRDRFEIGLIGDAPYTRREEVIFPAVIRAMDRNDLAFVVHVGDLQADAGGYREASGPGQRLHGASKPCTDQTLANRKEMLDSSRHPLILTPGDNDWTDCHFSEPRIDPLLALDTIRRMFFSDGRTLGQRSLRVAQQSNDPAFAKFRENLRWVHGDVVFATLHMVGSNNNLGRAPEADAEFAERDRANVTWMKQAFEHARLGRHKAVMIFTQANPFFGERWGPVYRNLMRLSAAWPPVYEYLLRFAPAHRTPFGFANFLVEFEREAVTFGRAVVLAHGDTHFHRVDRPLVAAATGRIVPNVTRVETFGSPDVHWVRVLVDPATPEVFTFQPQLAPEE